MSEHDDDVRMNGVDKEHADNSESSESSSESCSLSDSNSDSESDTKEVPNKDENNTGNGI